MTGLPVVVREPLTEPDPSLLSVRLACVKADSRVLTFAGGTLNRGRRSVHARIVDPGRVGMCHFDRLDVEISERVLGVSDLWIHANRMVHGRRETLTANAATVLRVEVAAAVAEFGFHEAWLAGFVARSGGVDAKGEEARCRWEADWWCRADLVERRLRRGGLSVVLPGLDAEEVTVDVAPFRQGDRSWELASAALVDAAGNVVGWLTDAGRVVPCCAQSRPQ